MTDLSPAVQAVLNAFTEDNSLHDWKHNHYNIDALAAALRAAADQVVPWQPEPTEESVGPTVNLGYAWALYSQARDLRQELFAIAAELEGADA